MLWETSPSCTELETHVLDWLVDMLNLPNDFKSINKGGGVIQDTASSASLCAIIAARERKNMGESNLFGFLMAKHHHLNQMSLKKEKRENL